MRKNPWFSGLSPSVWRVVLSIMLSGHGEKPDRVQLVETANAKLGRAIAKAQSSLAAECKTILDTTIGSLKPGPSLKGGEGIIFPHIYTY